MSVNNTEPSVLFGGTWERIKDRFLLAAGDTYSASSTGGEATHLLSIDEIPSHTHKTGILGDSAGSYNPGQNSAQVVFDQTAGLQTTATGGSKAHNNMPPYIVVNIWQRKA